MTLRTSGEARVSLCLGVVGISKFSRGGSSRHQPVASLRILLW